MHRLSLDYQTVTVPSTAGAGWGLDPARVPVGVVFLGGWGWGEGESKGLAPLYRAVD